MATPVKNTPILEGQEAEKFLHSIAQKLERAKTKEGHSEREKEMKRLEESFNAIRSLSRDSF